MVHTSKQAHRSHSFALKLHYYSFCDIVDVKTWSILQSKLIHIHLPPYRILDSLPASSVILIMAVSCCPIIARVEGLDRTAVSISVPSTMLSERLVKLTNRTVSPGWKVTTSLVIGVKSASPEVNVGIANHS